MANVRKKKSKTMRLRHIEGKSHVHIQVELSLKVRKEDDCYVAYCPDLELSSYGDTVKEAKQNFVEVLDIFFEEVTKKGTLEDVLLECGWQKVKDSKTRVPKWVPPAYVIETTIPFAYSA